MKTCTQEFIETINREKERQGISRYRPAKMAGVREMNLSYWRRGIKKPSAENMDKVMKALNVTMTIGASSPATDEDP
jgi:transcriptional regulator with XRE-family HTH domain